MSRIDDRISVLAGGVAVIAARKLSNTKAEKAPTKTLKAGESAPKNMKSGSKQKMIKNHKEACSLHKKLSNVYAEMGHKVMAGRCHNWAEDHEKAANKLQGTSVKGA